MTTCALYADPEAPGPLCGRPAVIVLATRCACGAATTRPVCAGCAAGIRERAAGGNVLRCMCPLTVEWVPLEVPCS